VLYRIPICPFKLGLSITSWEILSYEISQLMFGVLGTKYLEGVPIFSKKQFRANLCLMDVAINPSNDI
jgi:hypothetical protein